MKKTVGQKVIKKMSEVFKYIGASRDHNCQEVSALASQRLKKGSVEVQLRLEPTNPFDS